MPIAEPEIIKAAEKELFSSIWSSLDEFQAEELIRETHGLLLKEKMRFEGGKIIDYNNQIAYKLDYKSAVEFFVLVDETGKFSGFTDPNNLNYIRGEKTESNDKIIDPEIIEIRKAEFLDSVSVAINNKEVTELFRKRYQLETVDKIIYKNGEIMVLNDHVAYQFLYEADVILSILIDREGNYINFSKENHDMNLRAEEPNESDSSRLGYN
jgi:hypothetical protein